MTAPAPSIKEALEIVENLIRRDPACFNLSDELRPVRATLRALAALSQPDDARERIAPIWHKARNEWMRASRHGTQEQADSAAIDAILADGFVGDDPDEIKRLREDVKTLRRMVDNQARRWAEREAEIRADERERCAKIAESCFVLDDHWRLDIATAIRAGGER